MTLKEFSLEFDILYNNIMSDVAPSLNEYEKSVFLTQAQESIVIDLYNGNLNSSSFELTEENAEYLKELVTTIKPVQSNTGDISVKGYSTFYLIPEKWMFIVYEEAIIEDTVCNKDKSVEVIPVTHNNVHRLYNNPFKGPSSNRILRLIHGDKIELLSKFSVKDYTIRYIRSPKPIILTDLDDYSNELDGEYNGLHIGMDINGIPYTKKQECELNPAIHRAIVQRAVMLAKATWSSGT